MELVFLLFYFSFAVSRPPPLPPIPPGANISFPPIGNIEDEHIRSYETLTKISTEKGGFFEGDIFLNEATLDSAVVNKTAIWKNAIVNYVIGKELDDGEKQIIKGAINKITNSSCLVFLEFDKETVVGDFIHFRKLYGCYSHVGRQGGEQLLSVGDGCIIEGIIIHEILHALGFWHEQSRMDRDEYIEIRWHNIYPQKEKNFRKYTEKEIQHLNTPYDYSSIMHYNSHAFSRDGISPTIIPKNGAAIGQRSHLSETDKVKLNRLYCEKTVPVSVTTPSYIVVPTTPKPEKKETCHDISNICPFWAVNGHCVKSRRYMQVYCRKSCGFCISSPRELCYDHDTECTRHLSKDYCILFPEYTFTMCKRSCNYC